MVKQQAQIIDAKVIETNGKKEIELGKADFQKTVELAKIDLEKYKVDIGHQDNMMKARVSLVTDSEANETEKRVAAEDHSFQHDMALLEHAQGQQNADQQREHEIGMADMGQAHALEQGQQAADLAPQPDEGANS